MSTNKFIVLKTVCPACHTEHDVKVKLDEFQEYVQGKKNIQVAMPSLSAEEREYLISGLCSKCWDEMFPPDDED